MCILYKYLWLYILQWSLVLFEPSRPKSTKSTIALFVLQGCHCFGMRSRSRYISRFPSGSGEWLRNAPGDHRRLPGRPPGIAQETTWAPEVWEMWRQPHLNCQWISRIIWCFIRKISATKTKRGDIEWYRVMVWKTAFSSTWRFILVHKWLIAIQESSNVIICYEMF